MSEEISLEQLDEIVKKTIEALENGKKQIFEIAESARQEWKDLEAKLAELQGKVKEAVEEVEKLARLEKESRYRLMVVSKNFKLYSEDDIKKAYDAAREFQIRLALKREHEQNLIAQRTELEMRIRRTREIVERAEYLVTHVAVAMNYLVNALTNISSTIHELQKKEMMGIRIITAQEQERQRLARDIHDGPAQSLSNVVLKCELCEKLLERDVERAKQQIGELKQLVKSSLQEIRRIIFDLRPMSLDDLGLVPTLERYVATFIEETGIDVTFEVYDFDKKSVDKVVEVAVFRIIQEALNNIKKHSRATRASIKMYIKDGSLIVRIVDNGIGFDKEKMEEQKRANIHEGGFGIYGMKQRAELLKGKLTIQSQEGKGTVVLLQIPIDTNEKEV
ncbi:two-component system sensor histidine kinase DegS [Caldicoprobacter guelmensis]|uniref:sensor histidine kinase n=1 Tax=Caldicoprobacter guelmensis TaxID=1170224 RepID=UPI00195DDE10|nr:sensor histidine kinase [Caldicoprobacter guelmensis]MBM7581513.1 two-component system sensor histidine kinase DegS [Caldicoprobacter guelmensis]